MDRARGQPHYWYEAMKWLHALWRFGKTPFEKQYETASKTLKETVKKYEEANAELEDETARFQDTLEQYKDEMARAAKRAAKRVIAF